MSPFPDQLKLGLHQSQVTTHDRLIVAVSGGQDSMALLHGLLEVDLPASRLHVVHVHHQLQGAAADEAAQLVTTVCEQLQVASQIAFVDVQGEVDATGKSLEEVARQLRYQQLVDAAESLGASVIATAHHAQDQAETVLHQLIRGSGLRGLSGMAARRRLRPRIALVRPLLQIEQAELDEFVRARGIAFVQDPSNGDSKFTRNRIRHELLPQLQQDFNPQVTQRLQSLAQQASETVDWLDECAANHLQKALLEAQPASVRLDLKALQEGPPVLIRNLFVRLWQQQNWPRQKMTMDHWHRLWQLTCPDQTSAIDLPGGLRAERRQNRLHVFIR